MAINSKALKRYSQGTNLLIPHIDAYQRKGDFPPTWNIEIRNHKEPDPYFHPSGDCVEDPRALYAKAMGELPSTSVSAALRRVFDCGHFWHGYYQEILKEMGIAKSIEESMEYDHEDGWKARGTLDLLCEIPSKGEWIVDMKTVNDTEFDEGIRSSNIFKWTCQVNCYMHWKGVKKAFILAIRKGGTQSPGGKPMHDLKEIPIKYDESLIDTIYSRWSLVHTALKRGTPPTEEEVDAVAFNRSGVY